MDRFGLGGATGTRRVKADRQPAGRPGAALRWAVMIAILLRSAAALPQDGPDSHRVRPLPPVNVDASRWPDPASGAPASQTYGPVNSAPQPQAAAGNDLGFDRAASERIAAQMAARSDDAIAIPVERSPKANWYARVEYYTWNEEVDGVQGMEESGPLFSLGCRGRLGPGRYRGEVFFGIVDYDGHAISPTGDSIPATAETSYVGARAEYDLFGVLPGEIGNGCFIGLGTRLWNREANNPTTIWGDPVPGYDETWWTVYADLGLEREKPFGNGFTSYASARVGATVFTYENVPAFDVVLHPRPGLHCQVELGIRRSNLDVSLFGEGMTWAESESVDIYLQPRSEMLTFGLRAGCSF
jgi:hypothetical protein